jgi:Uma2 family endonuclease
VGDGRRLAESRGDRRQRGEPAPGGLARAPVPCVRVGPADPGARDRPGHVPDVSVVCESLELDPEDAKGHTVVNPILVVEVLSPSTEDYDRGEKLAHYKQVPSLREIVLVAHEQRQVEIWRRDGALWTLDVARDSETAALRSVACELPLTEVYLDPLASTPG